MSVLVKQSELKKAYTSFIWIDSIHPLLKYERAICHTTGIYGFNYRVYNVPNDRWNGVAIVCGDRSAGLKVRRDFRLEDEYLLKASLVINNNTLKDDEKKNTIQNLLIQFVTDIMRDRLISDNEYEKIKLELIKLNIR